MMKTTVELDQKLLRQAKQALGTQTIKETIHASLDEVVRRRKLQTLADALGTIPLDLTLPQLQAQRKKRTKDGAP
ncbi:MAG: type II toxin-antitoxin system VapB family antitoxin [Nitrospirota bacterium]|nr:type II toxin-antitoxin system VapB family antitoxin [Nitrospirota bacterium]